ncbi:MAG: DUF4340 domain-containing protein [Anaerolineales bacterium]|nr:DUF4340 domain-containing protein [Anaerolineales bacterium]
MKWRDVGILALIVIVLGGYVYYSNNREVEPEELPVPTPPPADQQPISLFPPVTPAEVTWLEVRYSGGVTETVITRDEAGQWAQTIPDPEPLISTTVDSQVGQLLTLTSRRTLAADANPLSAYGLEVPTAEIVLVIAGADGSSVRHTLHIGDGVTGGTGYYVQKVGDSKVYIVTNTTIDTILRLTSAPPLVPTPTPEPTATEPAEEGEATATPAP